MRIIASKNVLKLSERLEKEFNIEVDVESFHNTRAGKLQRMAGSFTWFVRIKGTSQIVGGYEPLSKHIIKKNKICIRKNRFGDFELYL